MGHFCFSYLSLCLINGDPKWIALRLDNHERRSCILLLLTWFCFFSFSLIYGFYLFFLIVTFVFLYAYVFIIKIRKREGTQGAFD